MPRLKFNIIVKNLYKAGKLSSAGDYGCQFTNALQYSPAVCLIINPDQLGELSSVKKKNEF